MSDCRGKRAELNLINDGIYTSDEIKEIIKPFDFEKFKCDKVVPEKFYISTANEQIYIIPIPNDKPIKVIMPSPWQFKDLDEHTIELSRPATEEEKQALLNYIDEYFTTIGLKEEE